jgi:uncharacterized protein YqeY
MTFVERLSQEIKAAMLAKNATRLSVLRMLKSTIGYAQIERKNENLSQAELVTIIQKEVKKRRDSVEQYEKGGRPDQAAQEKAEAAILEEFLPQGLSPEEVEQLVRAAIQEAGATSKKDMGAVMKIAQARAAGRADGKTLSTVVGKLLP